MKPSERQWNVRGTKTALRLSALNKLTTHLVTQTDAERGQENDKVRRDTITLVLVFLTLIATGVGDWFFYGQREEMVRAYEPLQKSARAAEIAANAALKQAIAEDRSSTAGRAYITAKLEPSLRTPLVFHKTDQVVSLSIDMHFSIKNFGQTPGVITKIETHMFISDQTKAHGSLDEFKEESPPNPTLDASIPLREKFAAPIVQKDGIITDRYADIQIIAPEGWESGTLSQSFSFERPAKIDAFTANIGTWFYCYRPSSARRSALRWLTPSSECSMTKRRSGTPI